MGCTMRDIGPGMDPTTAWLRGLGLERYARVFAENDIDLATVGLLAESDLEKLGVSLGHRKRLLSAIAELRGVPTAAPRTTAPLEARHPVPAPCLRS